MKTHNLLIESKLEELIDTLSEDITAGRMIVYHRTGEEQIAKGIAADGYRVGRGAWYGVGVYTTYDLESLMGERMEDLYGNIIIESKILDMKDFLIFDYDIAKKIYKSNYTLDKQLKKILGKEWNKYSDNEDIQKIIKNISNDPSGWAAKELYDNYEAIFDNCMGIVFTGTQDGKVLISYDRSNIEPIRYTKDNGKTWINVIDKNLYNRIKTKNSFKKYMDISTKDIHTKNKIDVGKSMSKDEFDNLSVELRDKYIQNKINTIGLRGSDEDKPSYNIYDQFLKDYEFKAASDEHKKLYVLKKMKNNYLEDYELDFIVDNKLADIFVEERVKSKWNRGQLSDSEYSNIPDTLKQLFIQRIFEEGLNIENNSIDYTLNSTNYSNSSDKVKQFYIEKILELEFYLSDQIYNDTPKELKQFYLKKIIEKKVGFIKNEKEFFSKYGGEGWYNPLYDQVSEQYRIAPIHIKKLYITQKVKLENYISAETYRRSPDEVKSFYIKKAVEKGMKLTEDQYKDIPNNLKQSYIENLVKKGNILSDDIVMYEFKNSPKLIKFYFKTIQDRNLDFRFGHRSRAMDLYNDYRNGTLDDTRKSYGKLFHWDKKREI